MSDNSTTVNFNLRTAGFVNYANQTLTFRLLTAGATGSNDFVVLPSVVTATSDANGDGSVVLFRNGVSDIESVHEVIFPNREKAQFIIPSGTATVELSNLLVNSQPTGANTQQSSVYAQAIQRANHTGTQLLSTISDAATVQLKPSEGAFANGDKTKLNSIETGATADQTNAEIRAAVEAATDSNVFTDADHTKLNTIAGSTTEEIQDIAGALVATGGTKTGIAVTYDDANNNMDFVVASQTDENFTTADHAKLDSLEAAAVSNFVPRSITFTNTSAFLSLADNAALDVDAGDFSLSFWARLDSSGTEPVLTKLSGTGYRLKFVGGSLILTMQDPSGSADFTLATGLADNKWHVYVVTVDRNGNIIAYVDNVAQTGVTASAAGDLGNDGQFQIGSDGGSNAADGIALGNYIALHKAVLTASQASQIFFSADAALTAVAPTLMVDLRKATNTFTDVGTNGRAVTTNGTIIFNESRIVQQSTTGTTTGFTAGSGTTAKSDSTFTGGSGTAYTTGDIVKALKSSRFTGSIMAISHKTNRLKLIGTPAVEQLQNGRYQLTVNCTTMNSREDWYSSNKARIFPDFGSLESAEMSIDGLAPRTGEAYTDMRLVSVESSTQRDQYIVTLVYQTLGDSFVQVKDDTVGYTESGLRRVTRQSIAKAGTDFQKTVGTTSITSQIDGEAAVTCVLANYEVNDTDSYREVTEVYLETGILSVQQNFNNGQKRVSVQAFNKTSAEVTSALSEVTGSHELISQQESDFAGIKTSTFEYQIDESSIEDYELNGLKRLQLLELDTTGLTPQTVGAKSASGITSGLRLGSQEIDNGGTIKVRESLWYKDGTLSVNSKNLSAGVREVTTTFLGEETSVVGPIIRRSENNFDGLKTISVTSLQDKNGASIVGTDPNPVHSYQQLVDFKRPGVVSIIDSTGSAGEGSGEITVKHHFYNLKPPVTSKVEATVNVFFQTESNIVSGDLSYNAFKGLWNPTSWAEGKIEGLYTNFNLTTAHPMSQTKGFVGYTTTESDKVDVTGGIGSNVKAIEGKYIFPGDSASIEVSGGPGVPSGTYVLDVNIVPAFEDLSGTMYFKKTIVNATV